VDCLDEQVHFTDAGAPSGQHIRRRDHLDIHALARQRLELTGEVARPATAQLRELTGEHARRDLPRDRQRAAGPERDREGSFFGVWHAWILAGGEALATVHTDKIHPL